MSDLCSASGVRWASDDRPELAQHGAFLLAGAAAALMVQLPPQPQVQPAVSSGDRLGDRLVAHGLGSSDRHRRLPVLHQAPGDTPSLRRIFYEPRDFRRGASSSPSVPLRPLGGSGRSDRPRSCSRSASPWDGKRHCVSYSSGGIVARNCPVRVSGSLVARDR